MIAMFKGVRKSMRYKPGKKYVLATTYHNGYLWIVDVYGKGKSVAYASAESFLDNWIVLKAPDENADILILTAVNDECDKNE